MVDYLFYPGDMFRKLVSKKNLEPTQHSQKTLRLKLHVRKLKISTKFADPFVTSMPRQIQFETILEIFRYLKECGLDE